MVGSGLAAWFTVVMASIACAVELAISGTVPLRVALPAMAGVHVLIGIGEGLITAAVLALVLATRSDLLELQKA
jgi:cobalt/nickel transport system permease protein